MKAFIETICGDILEIRGVDNIPLDPNWILFDPENRYKFQGSWKCSYFNLIRTGDKMQFVNVEQCWLEELE